MVRLHGLRNEIIILNTFETINDLLVKQGHLYAHRPVFTLANELMGASRVRTNCFRACTVKSVVAHFRLLYSPWR